MLLKCGPLILPYWRLQVQGLLEHSRDWTSLNDFD